ncbi:hypothetical protein SAMN05216215_104475 [Saccharopolyspora shandongensis]|uniref:Uncharacterized protein n=1 Tax=Saccharopolyspora shandongensis TaxID=418495 RepID=A0A1H3PXQ0_9PSEU|nr:hypothetical protein [Saccharopolyspora shandongensis]SDZ06072.1 hypothetical protein SAMN05216215_104475 [Saccharopolyspora shandongensis]
MHSGRKLGWSGQLDWPPTPEPPAHGRHRVGSPVSRTSAVRPRRPAHSLGARLTTDPLVDTMPVGGLHKFDLGMVPASVTPPRTWRQAAWFAIASSAAALGGLMFATTLLAGGSTTIKGLELPSMPRGEYPPVAPTDPYYLTGDPTRPEAVRATGSVQPLQPSPPLATSAGIPIQPNPIGSSAPGAPGLPTSGTTPTTSSPTRTPELLFADTGPVKQRGEEYYAAIGRGDLRSAYALTTGSLHAEGYEAFAARYSRAKSVEVVESYATPTSTLHTVRLTMADGTVQTQRRELRYTMADEPLITSDERIA